MTLDEAFDAHPVSAARALAEMASHSMQAVIQDGELFALCEFSRGDHPERICAQWERVNLDTRSILEWLGY